MTMRILKIALAVGLTAALIFVLARRATEIARNVALRDSVSYWAAARLLVHHQDPYDHASVLQLEREHGYRDERPLVLRTPPWSLFMVLPLGRLSPFSAWIGWIATLLACLVVGLRLTRRLYEPEPAAQNLFAVVAYSLAPVPACLVSGQMGLVLMLGIVLFFYWEEKHPYWAGVALIFPFAKPHLLSLFWLALLVLVVTHKKTRIAMGFVSALAGATLVALFFDPHVFAHYRGMLQVAGIQKEFIPALSGVLRLLLFRRFFWVQFVPLGIGVIWCLRYLASNWQHWDWRQHGPALLVVSILITPYEWLTDETVLLPAILQAVALVYMVRGRLKVFSKLALVGLGCLNVLLLLILRFKIPFSTGIYFWSSLVWFGFYFYARRLYRKHAGDAALAPSPSDHH